LNETIEIEYKQAIELYKLILNAVKGPEVQINTQGNNNNSNSLNNHLNNHNDFVITSKNRSLRE
jgi:hypothetical protein